MICAAVSTTSIHLYIYSPHIYIYNTRARTHTHTHTHTLSLSLSHTRTLSHTHRPGLAQPKSERKARVKAARIATALTNALNERDGSASTCTFEFLVESMATQNAATEEELEALMDHFQKKLREIKLREAEVIALRGYSGPLFVKMNGSLRKVSGKFPEEMTRHLKGNKYVNLIFACSSGMRKLSRASTLPIGGTAWRGLGGVKLPDAFLKKYEGTGLGGVDFAYLSFTSKREVAISYVGRKSSPVLFKIQLGNIDRACPISFISQFPKEEELLIPAMSNIEVTGRSYLMDTKFGRVSVYPARVNCNLKSMTLEQIEERRQTELVDMLPYLKAELDQSLEPVIQALKQTSKERQACGVGMLLESDPKGLYRVSRLTKVPIALRG